MELFVHLVVGLDRLQLLIELIRFLFWCFSFDEFGSVPVSLSLFLSWHFGSDTPWATNWEHSFVPLASRDDFDSITVGSPSNPGAFISSSIDIN